MSSWDSSWDSKLFIEVGGHKLPVHLRTVIDTPHYISLESYIPHDDAVKLFPDLEEETNLVLEQIDKEQKNG